MLYLSIIRDFFDLSIVAYKTGTEQSVNLVLDTIREAVQKEKVAVELQLHSDQGFQYTSHAYFSLTKEYGVSLSCQDAATATTTLWLKISFLFSNLSASAARSFSPSSRPVT